MLIATALTTNRPAGVRTGWRDYVCTYVQIYVDLPRLEGAAHTRATMSRSAAVCMLPDADQACGWRGVATAGSSAA